MAGYNLYVPNKTVWERTCGRSLYNENEPQCKVYENAIVEELKNDPDAVAGSAYLGGVCEENGTFITGHLRSKYIPTLGWSISGAYKYNPEEIVYLEGEYLYGGIIVHVFGHLLSDSMVRLWYLAKNTDFKGKIIFFSTTPTPSNAFWAIVDLLGIDRERIIIAKGVYRCEKLYVPDQSLVMWNSYTSESRTIYLQMVDNALSRQIPEKEYSTKIYLTRTKFIKGDCFNEKYFEDFYRKRGFEIVSLETYPFEEQVRIVANAEEIVSTLGTLTHFVMFTKKLRKFTMLLRHDEVTIPQIMMNQAVDVEYDVIDVSMAPLPTVHAAGVFILGPTKYWKSYLDENGVEYDDSELEMDWSCLYGYLKLYASLYSKPGYAYSRIKHWDIYDVIERMNFTLFDDIIPDRKKMGTPSKTELDHTVKDLKQQLEVATDENKNHLAEIEILKKQKQNMEDELLRLSDDNIAIKAERDDLSVYSQNVVSESNEQKQNIKSLIEENNIIKEEKQNLINRTQELENDVADVRIKNDELQTELHCVKSQNTELSETVAQIRQENTNLRTRVYVPRCLDLIDGGSKKTMVKTIVSGDDLYVDEIITEFNIEKVRKQYSEVNNRWGSVKGLFYAYVSLGKYDLLDYSTSEKEIIPSEIINKLKVSKIDIVTCQPTQLDTSIKENFIAMYSEELWNIMLESIKRKSPELYSEAETVFGENELYSCSSLLIKKNSFTKFADWALSILNDIGANITSKEIDALDRIADLLLTLFIIHNEKTYLTAIWE